jgi:hypothetical protein
VGGLIGLWVWRHDAVAVVVAAAVLVVVVVFVAWFSAERDHAALVARHKGFVLRADRRTGYFEIENGFGVRPGFPNKFNGTNGGDGGNGGTVYGNVSGNGNLNGGPGGNGGFPGGAGGAGGAPGVVISDPGYDEGPRKD